MVTREKVALGRNPCCPSSSTEGKAGTTAQMQMSGAASGEGIWKFSSDSFNFLSKIRNKP